MVTMKRQRPRRLYLVRHGATAWNLTGRFTGQSDIPLSTLGAAQAKAIGLALKSQIAQAGAILVSDLQRALVTAELMIAARGHPAEVLADPRWREASFGEWEGHTWGEIETAYPEHARRWSADAVRQPPPGGEGLGELAHRGGEAIIDALTAGPNAEAPIIVVTHGGLIRATVARFALGDVGRFWSLDVPPGSAVVVSPSVDPSGSLGSLRLRVLRRIVPRTTECARRLVPRRPWC